MDYESLIRSAGFTPERLVSPGSWIGHIPFAAWLIQTLRPQVFVELGTHQGNSYFSFCQARKEADLSTKCFAVDTWQGGVDEEGDQDVFFEVKKYHEARYSSFSRLLRMTFDEAAKVFPDGTIDLLHLNGLKTYEAVKHDFETWLPKLHPSAVVLFHNTNVRGQGFGVWQFWSELVRQYPLNLEFFHSNGLGVLQLSEADGRFGLDWLLSGTSEKRLVGVFFSARGEHMTQQYARIDLTAEIVRLHAEAEQRDARILELGHEIASRDYEIARLNQEISARDQEITDGDERITSLQRALKESDTRLSEMLLSTSWRASAPLRAAKQLASLVAARPIADARKPSTALADPFQSLHTDFDADFYLNAYPDVAAAGFDARRHYLTSGAKEGRLGSLPVPRVHGNLDRLDPRRPNVLIVSHQASRTGAPILSLNIARHLRATHNVIALVFADYGLLAEFRKQSDVLIGPLVEARNPVIVGLVLSKLFSTTRLSFAIVNSIESRAVLPWLGRAFIPSICLVHEFASYTRPVSGISEAAFWASEVVFSATIVRESAEEACSALGDRPAVILPQGRSLVPKPERTELENSREAQRIREVLRPASLPENTVVILGAGSVCLRKGVDLFIACAAKVAALRPRTPYRFVWVGHGFDAVKDTGYSVYLQDQLRRSSLEAIVVFAGELENMDVAYEVADVLLLSSRLDPLPNVTIDAAYYRRPIVCFDRATGIAEFLTEAGLAQACVAPYLDIDEAARRLVACIESEDLRERAGQALESMASTRFNMEPYVERLVQLAARCASAQEIERADCALIESAGDLSSEFAAGPANQGTPIDQLVRAHVRSWASGVGLRKPFAGFHPGIYRDIHGLSSDDRNPLADYIEAGRPHGPWHSDVINPSAAVTAEGRALRKALHIHAYYPDLVPDMLRRLEGQVPELDLLVSVTSKAAADEVGRMLSKQTKMSSEVRVVPNRGRDIGPFLTEFGPMILDKYDLIGHIHTKKSLDINHPEIAKIWLDFLLENLLGGRQAMAARIISRFAVDEGLGLVFPDDPNACGWSENKALARELADRLAIDELPERHFWFPVGTMFWARVRAIEPLLQWSPAWEDYPKEPLPSDGTMLHAIERVFPFVAAKTGHRIALTNVPGVTR
jgi:glycosyltransferase involved in cell wall biosynthesis